MYLFGTLNGYGADADDRDSTDRGRATYNSNVRNIDICEYIAVMVSFCNGKFVVYCCALIIDNG
jgi:hypothetical protein